MGQILPLIGRDWSHSGVAHLFSHLHGNGYKLLYLSARAIGQSRSTKEMLRSIKQGNLVLPEGPLLLNPTSLISAFHRSVLYIWRFVCSLFCVLIIMYMCYHFVAFNAELGFFHARELKIVFRVVMFMPS